MTTSESMIDRLVYPVMAGVASIHVTPEGAWLTTKEKIRIDKDMMPDAPVDRLIAYYPALPINKVAREFLSLCDGTTSYSDILDALHKQYKVPMDRAVECIEPFYRRGIEIGYFKSARTPRLCKIPVTGRTDIYLPVHLQFELTDQCNMFCDYCYRNALYTRESSIASVAASPHSFQVIEQAYETCLANGVRAIELSGGEPMMSKHFADIIKLLARHGILVAIETNGTLINNQIADLLAESGNVMLSVSLDGPNEKINCQISHLQGAFQRTIDGLKRLAKRKIVFRVATTVCKENIDHIEELLLLAQDLGAVQYGCSLPMSFGRQKAQESLDTGTGPGEQLGCRFIPLWNELVEKYPHFIARFDDATWNYHQQVGNCGAGHRSFGVAPDGNVRICTVNTAKWSEIGNLYRDPYEEIFTNPLVRFFRNLKAPSYDICGECPDLMKTCANCVMRGINMYLSRQERGEQCQWAEAFEVEAMLANKDIGSSPDAGCAKVRSQR